MTRDSVHATTATPDASGVANQARRPRVKICCIQSVAEAHLAASLAADIVGLVSAMPSAGVDLCSSVRTDDHLDADKLGAFFRALGATSTATRPS